MRRKRRLAVGCAGERGESSDSRLICSLLARPVDKVAGSVWMWILVGCWKRFLKWLAGGHVEHNVRFASLCGLALGVALESLSLAGRASRGGPRNSFAHVPVLEHLPAVACNLVEWQAGLRLRGVLRNGLLLRNMVSSNFVERPVG